MRTCRCRRRGNPTQIIIGTFFNGGLRAYDIIQSVSAEGDRRLRAAGAAISPAGAIQLNDVFVDEREIVYTVDRHSGGLYILEMDF